MILMQPHWYDKHLPNASEAYVASRVPPNCQFFFENIIELAWKNDYPNQDLIHVGEIGGDPKLLQAVLDGAFAYVPLQALRKRPTYIWQLLCTRRSH